MMKVWLLVIMFLVFGGGQICVGQEGGKSWSKWEVVLYNGRDYIPVDNLRAFYGMTAPAKQESGWFVLQNKVAKIQMKVRSQEVLMNRLRFILSYPVVQDASGRLLISKTDLIKIFDPVLRPQFIKNAGKFNLVILDPGHGGHDAGATNGTTHEADLNLKLAQKLKTVLTSRGFKVVMTRSTDTFLTLEERVSLANKYNNAIFVSLHFNSGQPGASGVETFTLTPMGTSSTFQGKRSSDQNFLRGNTRDSANIALATAVQGSVQRGVDAVDRGIKRARFSVLCGINHPAILFEGGFVTNPKELVLLNNENYLDKMADKIATGIQKYKKFVGGR